MNFTVDQLKPLKSRAAGSPSDDASTDILGLIATITERENR